MNPIFDMLANQIDDRAIRTIGSQIGADEATTQQAVQVAIPMLVGSLARNASTQEGAGSLLGALVRDHDGSILDDVGGALLSQATARNGAGILKHAFGSQRAGVEQGLGRATGLDAQQVGKLLALLAPLVMGALGRKRQTAGFEAGGLGELLQQERRHAEQRNPAAGGLLGALLDKDGDGSIADDLGNMGLGMLGKMMRDRQ